MSHITCHARAKPYASEPQRFRLVAMCMVLTAQLNTVLFIFRLLWFSWWFVARLIGLFGFAARLFDTSQSNILKLFRMGHEVVHLP